MGHQAQSLVLAHESLAETNQINDSFLKIGGCLSDLISRFWLGDLTGARSSESALHDVYRQDQHSQIINLLGHDIPTIAGIYTAHRLWMMGYPDQAVLKCDEKDDIARGIGHPINLGLALTLGNWVFHYRREPLELLKRADEALAVVDESGLTFLAETHVQIARMLALLDSGQLVAGIDFMKNYFRSPFRLLIGMPYFLVLWAEATAKLGRLKEGVDNIAQAIEQIERPGWGERCHYAEILRIKGWILQQQGECQNAEFNLRASIDFARKQQAKSWELRTSTTLAEILAERGERRQAIELLKPVYDWFTEGFDTYDLKQAKKLLDQIA